MVSFYELGERFPPYDIINKLADYFNVSTDYLLGRSDIKNPEKLLSDYSKLTMEELKEIEKYIQQTKNKS
ncbi:MAG: helix-turn-helix domain-containing protein [Vulcanibacillus sp.]